MTRIQKAIRDHFNVDDSIVIRSVVSAKNDPGQWDRSAKAIIYYGHGLPHFYHPLWETLNLGKYFMDPINSEVAGVYT